MKLWKPAVLGTALMALLMLGIRMTAAVPASGWGLSFPVPGQPPAGPLGPEKLGMLDAAYLDPDGGKVL